MPPPPNTGRDPLYRPAEGPSASSLASATASRIAAGRRNDESWVEVASQPSSSSVSSIADEIVVTGLRVGSSANGAAAKNGLPHPQRRRRLLQQVEAATGGNPSPPAPSSLAGSSQEEYDESESEEDRVMIAPSPSPPPRLTTPATASRTAVRSARDVNDDDEDDDDNGTALGVPTFRPQPNAFSHPPTHALHHHLYNTEQQHHSVPTPPHQHIAPQYTRSMSSRSATPAHHRPGRNTAPGFVASAYREDNDAVLRASLSTLLSCAAAARGLPKKEGGGADLPTYAGTAGGGGSGSSERSPATAAGQPRLSNQPMDLRLVPESELMNGDDDDDADQTRTATLRAGGAAAAKNSVLSPPRTRGQRAVSGTSRAKHAESAHHHNHHNHHPSSWNSAVSAVSTSSKTKRSGGGSKSSSASSPRVIKKKRTSSVTDESGSGGVAFMSLSPTMLTWVVSAGVVVLVSVVGFGAGFVIGREVGRQEAGSSMLDATGMSHAASAASASAAASAANATSCGREIMRSSTGSTLRRFRWGAMTGQVSA